MLRPEQEDAMKFGAALPYGSAKAAARLARIAEEAGWDGIFLGDASWLEDPMVCLAAAAMTTKRIRLGTMVIPVPLRRPWKLASESIALDQLSDGRLILGLGAGAVWMGWQAFPDEPTDKKARAGMLDETIDILTLLFQRIPFDYDGKHYHIKLTELDESYYPPKPIQQPRIPMWVPGIWPRMKSMRRILKCDGLLPQKMNSTGEFEAVTPTDLRQMKDYIDANRSLTTPFDYVVEGNRAELNQEEAIEKVNQWAEAGATWWIEGLWETSEEDAAARLRQGPPRMV
ncbi:MAG: LLM class flavin-dependent oxidoreductase [Anaerolineae bacterium]|nr:LLM class flavin-dependent oxidoreductase [Anaerolineae bacterium]